MNAFRPLARTTLAQTTLVLAMLALAMPAPAWAHAALVRADPSVGGTVAAAPGEVTLNFSEDVVPRLSKVVVEDGAGHTVSSGVAGSGATLQVKLAGRLPAGRYTVTWHVVSTDSHKTQGRFAFTVAP